ncbi:Ty3/Gypsy family RNase HI domain-containing protein, partial [Salmonella enterica subsp. enterica serovar Derby]|nr:Ty3/Gypsy family RNase HI domain-containing protein [Salmonella enterica subsp. enterica serovar Derby]
MTAAPLNRLSETKQKFIWTGNCQEAFNKLKEALSSAPILAHPRPNQSFILDTDANNTGIGAVLSQVQDGQKKVIAYFSKSLSKPERNYCVTRKELLAVVKAVEHFHHYLYGQKFLVRTDHGALRWLLSFRNPEGQTARWIQRLQEYHFTIEHRSGCSHRNADALSRRPCAADCKSCSRVEVKFCPMHALEVCQAAATSIPEEQPDPWSPSVLRRVQLEDDDIGPILRWKE